MPTILEFPNIMRQKSPLYTSICIVVSIYIFVILAIVCDEYMVPAMERLCYKMRMPYNVAGATFLAACTSSPELFVSLIGIFVAKGYIGIGTIVGSSVFNILGVAAICGIISGIESPLEWWPITRDCVWYLISILTLFGILYDSKVKLHEAIVIVLLYVLYLIELVFDRKIQKLFRISNVSNEMIMEDPLNRKEQPLKSFREAVCTMPQKTDKWWRKVWWGIKYPATVLLAITVPSTRSYIYLTLLSSVAWIGGLSYLITWTLTIIGYNFNIPDSITGLTILAVGTSLPEILASFIVVKKGYASMAMCNAIGSNTFDIFICLGLPWMICIIVTGKPYIIDSNGSPAITVGMLMLTATIVYFAFIVTNFVLGKVVGWLSLIAYTIFLALAISMEVFQLKKMCDIE